MSEKIVNAPHCTAKPFIYLEFGVAPIRYLIHKNQLMFLHHVVHLEEGDPVKKMWESMKIIGAQCNWWSCVRELMIKYHIELKDVEDSNRDCFKRLVKRKVFGAALEELNESCKEKKKTAMLNYGTLEPQEYLRHLYPAEARIIFKCRSKTLDIKDHRPYKYKDKLCRNCSSSDETIEHITNCGHSDIIDTSILDNLGPFTYDTKVVLQTIARRIGDFLDKV